MRKRRIVTDELTNRVHRAEEVIYDWMITHTKIMNLPNFRIQKNVCMK